MNTDLFKGILVPALTPFKHDLSPDINAFVAHCFWLLEQGADGLAVFGTTSEANSLGLEERMTLLDHLIESGISTDVLMPGTGTTSITDTVRLTKHALERGCSSVLMLPPFYYKAINDDGLYASFSEIIQRVGNSALRVYLYHIPPVAKISISLNLIEQLLKSFGDTVVGLKDSSGDWANTSAVLSEFPSLATFCGSEVFLLDTLKNGGAGSITATANVNVANIRNVYKNWQKENAKQLQKEINSVRKTFENYPVIPALKAILSIHQKNPNWPTVRPPLECLRNKDTQKLSEALNHLNFNI
ncbi:MAG: dihydrodipicolinate synthase family protein [Rhodospirillaceae bacterium]|nr:dihydrodipicolinate synthase family protein [Rhodospirillaceae bacterium]|tara:strand:- start:11015 stop:11917 length:903 start_codon:yes stop_codon:yes gene_type:complete